MSALTHLFGKAKPKAPPPTLADARKNISARDSAMDEKVKKLDADIMAAKKRMAQYRQGTPAYNREKQRALQLLKRRKMVDSQQQMLQNQQFNMDNVDFTIQTQKDTVTTIAAMKSASQEMKVQAKSMNIGKIQDTMDDLADGMEDANEINEILGQSFGMPEDVDESELNAELEDLEGDMLGEKEGADYLNLPDAPMAGHAGPVGAGPAAAKAAAPAAAAPQALDEYGLPS